MRQAVFTGGGTTAALISVLLLISCADGDDDGGGSGGSAGGSSSGGSGGSDIVIPREADPETAPVFRSYNSFPMTSPGTTNCRGLRRSVEYPSGVRPMCARTTVSVGSCVIVGVNSPDCHCYEGQAHACDADVGGPCVDGVNCGIRACVVTSDTYSRWDSECVRLTLD